MTYIVKQRKYCTSVIALIKVVVLAMAALHTTQPCPPPATREQHRVVCEPKTLLVKPPRLLDQRCPITST